MTVIVTLNGPIFWAIWGDITQNRRILGQYWGNIGQYWTKLKDIGVFSSSVKSVMYWARAIQVVTGQFFVVVNFVWPCQARYVTILLKTADIGQCHRKSV